MTRFAFANVGAEAGLHLPRTKRADWPKSVVHLVDAWTSLVDDPPWPWLERARGLIPWLADDDAANEAIARKIALWGAAPSVVRVVHDKAFALRVARDSDLDEIVPGVAVVLESSEVNIYTIRGIVDEWPDWARRSFTVKPRWGTSGRGRVGGQNGIARIGGRAGSFTHGAVVEPWLDRTMDLSTLWFVDEHGEPHVVGVTQPKMRGAGVYLGCDVVVGELGLMAGTKWDEPAIERARVVVEAAAKVGYRGPCGVDAFTWRDEAGELHLRGVVELNARFTAGHVALGLIRRRGPKVGERFRFRLDNDEVLTVVS